MILPIYTYGAPVLKKRALEIQEDYADLKELLESMWETMYNASGVGLAAPQIGRAIQLFIVDTVQLNKEGEDTNEGIKQVFINAKKISEDGEFWDYEEGCLSIPNIRGDVERQERITLTYFDAEFISHKKTFEGMDARVIQHEFDHTQGVLFTEKLKPVKRNLIRRKLEQMKRGKVSADYPLRIIPKK